MLIAHLLGSLNRGGTETLLLDLFRSAAIAPFRMTAVCRHGGEMEEAFAASDVPVTRISMESVATLPAYLLRLRRHLLSDGAAVVHAHQRLDAVLARVALAGTGIPVVQSIHGYGDDTFTGRLLTRLSLRVSSRNLFVSDTVRRDFEARYPEARPERSVTVHNAIRFDKFSEPVAGSLRNEFNADPQTLLMGMVGNFVPGRDHLAVCRFLALLAGRIPGFRFLFIGKASAAHPGLYEACTEFCRMHGLADRVIFAGARSDVPSLLPQLDAFVYATRHDTFGIAVAEAIACGVPVFVNDHPVMREVTLDGTLANLWRDEADLLEQFIAFSADPKPFRKRAAANSGVARERYGMERHIEKLGSIYDLRF